MQINKFIQDVSSRYSCHFVAWIFPLILLMSLLAIYFLWLYFANKIDVGTGQIIAWFGIVFIPPIIMPCVVLEYILIFLIIYHFETTNCKYRFSNNFFNSNLFLQLIFLILFVVGILLYLFLVCFTAHTIFISDTYKDFFLSIGIPAMISILPINLFFYKFLHNKVLHKK